MLNNYRLVTYKQCLSCATLNAMEADKCSACNKRLTSLAETIEEDLTNIVKPLTQQEGQLSMTKLAGNIMGQHEQDI